MLDIRLRVGRKNTRLFIIRNNLLPFTPIGLLKHIQSTYWHVLKGAGQKESAEEHGSGHAEKTAS